MKTLADICDWSGIKKYLNIINKKGFHTNKLIPLSFFALEDETLNHLERAKTCSKSFSKEESLKLEINKNYKIKKIFF